MFLRQSTASQEISFGPFLDSTDGNTEENGLTIANTDVKIRKGGTIVLVNKNSGGLTNISNGVYYATLDATDTNTLGKIEIYVHVAGALAVKNVYTVLPAASYDALITNGLNNLGGTAQTADHTAAIADIPTVSEFNARTLVAASYFDPAADTVANVTLVATTTTNTDMVGTNGANTVVPPSVAQFNARTVVSADYFLVTDYTAPDNAGITANGVAIAALNDLSSAQVNAEMLDVLTTDTFAEVTVPSSTASIKDMIHYTFSRVTNKTTQTATTLTVRNTGDTGNLATATVSDDGTTFTKGKET